MTTPETKSTPLDVFTAELDGCTLVEASAGTGKTWAICGLVLRLLLEQRLTVQQVLVVTFTKAATAELKDRMRSRIDQTLQRLRQGPPATPDPDTFVDDLLARLHGLGLDDATLAARLDQALQDFDDAAIFTIHGWCQRALGDTPLATGLPLRQELQADDSLLRLQVAQDFWRRHVVHAGLPPELLSHLAQRGDSPQGFADLLKRSLAKPLALLKWPEGIEHPATQEDIERDAAAASTLDQAFAAARAAWAPGRDGFLDLLQAARPSLHKTQFSEANIAAATAEWDRLLAGSDPLAEPAADPKKPHLQRFAASALKPKKGMPGLAPHPFPGLAQALVEARSAVDESLALARLRLVKQWLEAGPEALQQAKRQARVLAYDDLLLNLHQRLHGPHGDALAQVLGQRYPAALIDEFQDTDPVQYAIFSRIYLQPAAPLPLFLVGDPKQAIYSFRHADLRTYLRARDAATRQATLADNQRSVLPLVQACNALFGRHPNPFRQAGLHFTPVGVGRKQRALLQTEGAALAPLQLWALPGDAPLSKARAEDAVAAATAADIAGLLASAQAGRLRLGGRPLAAGDVAVLVRSHRQGALMRQALAACGVASVEQSQASLWDSSDAEELQRVLAAVLAPTHAGSVRAALATALLGLDASALAALADDEAAYAGHVQTLNDLRLLWAARGVGAMLRRLQARYAVPQRLLARADGERRMTNLLHLAECLQQAASEHPAPEALLRWLQQQRSDPALRDAEATQLRLESDRERVQIVTIHRSKGLEYPFVYAPFLFDGAPGGGGARLEGREGFDEAGRATIDFRPLPGNHPEVKDCKDAADAERLAENLRLVYVALTRAVQRCTLVVGPYYTLHGRSPTPSFKQAAGSSLQWLLTGLPDVKPDPAAMAQHWQEFAAELGSSQPGAVELRPLPGAVATRLQVQRPAPENVSALPGPRQLPVAWRMGSYSSLTQGARHEAAAVDHDRRLLPEASDVPALAPAANSNDSSIGNSEDNDILQFPRGAAAGECLHAVFEHIDFGDPTTWPAAIAQALAQHAAELPGASAAAVQAMLADVLHTPLLQGPAGPLTLAQVPTTRRLNELEFTLPAPALQPGALQALLQSQGLAGPVLSFTPLHGYLRGFIDLVFEHGGRFHVLDWKSNHLGHTPADYAPPALALAMSAQGYHLQLLLYTLALHRLLQQRLPGYDYDTHVGPGLYLFVRGVRPGWQAAGGAPCGVHAWRPSLALVEALSDLLGQADPSLGGPSLEELLAETVP